jgi:hypothetical protein
MSLVLRAYGDNFDVDTCLAGCTLSVCAVIHRGEPVFSATKPEGRRYEQSGVHVSIGDADFDEFPRQVADAIEFLRAQHKQLQRLCEFPSVQSVTLDFGIARRDMFVQCDSLPPELIRLAGGFGMGIEISQYPIEEPDA